MNTDHITQLLKHKGVQPTANRIIVFRALSGQSRPLSLSDLEERIDTIDKSGIFRVLSLFSEKGLVHVIDDGSRSLKYEPCHAEDHCSGADMHVHFHCHRCGRTLCFDTEHIPAVTLPAGYVAQTVNYVIKGICPGCNVSAGI